MAPLPSPQICMVQFGYSVLISLHVLLLISHAVSNFKDAANRASCSSVIHTYWKNVYI